jgi:long-chain fatty acid transport protein
VSAYSSDAYASITLPATVDLSWAWKLNDAAEFFASATWTGWSSFKELRVKFDNGNPDDVTPENWHDTWRLAVGANYRLNDKWLLRAGLAYDQTPVRDQYRTVRIPDNDRRWLSVGTRYRVSAQVVVDLAYTHIFTDSTPISETAGTPIGTLNGDYDSSVDIASVQVVWKY